jgi:hypothetical protein
MASKWRIVSTTHNPHCIRHVLQKRLFGFLWWYNPDNKDAYHTGVYLTFNEARAAYRGKMFTVSKTVTMLGEEDCSSNWK